MVGLKLRFIREFNRLYFNVLKVFWHLQGRDAARVYMFHSVLDNKEELYSKFAISTALFERFIKFELSRGQKAMNEEDLLKAIDNPDEFKNCFAVTFDDIYDSVYTNAFPILKKHNIPFVVFVTPGLIGNIDENPKSLKPMITFEHLVSLLSDPLCVLGSHGMEHKMYRTYSKGVDALAFSESKKWLEDYFGTTVRLFAFPFGRRVEVSDKNIKTLSKAGYECGFSALDGTLKQKWLSGRWFLPRILVGEDYVTKHCREYGR